MAHRVSKRISVFEFGCEAPLRFFEHCQSCPRFGDDCPDLAMGKEILRGKKKVAYGDLQREDTLSPTAFHCLAPLYYFERTRKKCGHAGRCREEGLLLALLDGKKTLDYSRKDPTEFPVVRRRKTAKAKEATTQKVAAS
ncbi:MAG: hypothetical protein SWE60_21435 [Thermodesulfobacteriota bacterium]|nr:hypothetical protein [Thermodesulfobacteriota bacterium]